VGYTNNLADANNSDYQAGELTVGTSQILACANGSSNMSSRQNLIVYNRSSTVTVYIGPTGVTTSSKGIPIPPQSAITFNTGSSINMYLIANSAGNTVTVQELG
jgi:hypothetical protein